MKILFQSTIQKKKGDYNLRTHCNISKQSRPPIILTQEIKQPLEAPLLKLIRALVAKAKWEFYTKLKFALMGV